MKNVAPTLINVTGDSIQEGHVATISLNVVDPGTLDIFTANVNWKDGTVNTITLLGDGMRAAPWARRSLDGGNARN